MVKVAMLFWVLGFFLHLVTPQLQLHSAEIVQLKFSSFALTKGWRSKHQLYNLPKVANPHDQFSFKTKFVELRVQLAVAVFTL